MAIITITRGSTGYGNTVAEKLAKKLDYACFSRETLRHDAAEQFDLPEIKFFKTIENPPTLLDRVTGGRDVYIAYLRSAFLKRIREGNIVYHGYMGQLYVKDVPNVMKVLITSSLPNRIRELQKREQVSDDEAPAYLERIDASRDKWSRHVYGIDALDPNLYDMAFRVDNLSVGQVVDTLAAAAQLPCFQVSSSTLSKFDDLALEEGLQAMLVGRFRELIINELAVSGGQVRLHGSVNSSKTAEDIRRAVAGFPGVGDVDVQLRNRSIGVGP